MTPEKPTGLTRILRAFVYSAHGFKAAFQSEAAFRQELCLLAIGTLIALMLDIGAIEQLLLISSLVLVLIVELLNTALETVVDRISSDRHTLSKKAKDIGSAAVLIALLHAGVVWLVILAR